MAEPMYRQVARALEQQILSGELSPGQQIRSELELRSQYEASRNTIRDAIRWLVSRGLVETRAGQGTFVAQRIQAFVTVLSADSEEVFVGGDRRDPTASRPKVEIHAAAANLAVILRLSEGDRVVSRQQERFVDGIPWSLQTAYYPMSLVDQGAAHLAWAEPIRQGTDAYLEETLGLKQIGFRDRFLTGPPDEAEIRFFGMPDDGRVPVIAILRTGYTDSPQGPIPFRVTVTIYPGDRNQLITSSGEVPSFIDDEVDAHQRVFSL